MCLVRVRPVCSRATLPACRFGTSLSNWRCAGAAMCARSGRASLPHPCPLASLASVERVRPPLRFVGPRCPPRSVPRAGRRSGINAAGGRRAPASSWHWRSESGVVRSMPCELQETGEWLMPLAFVCRDVVASARFANRSEVRGLYGVVRFVSEDKRPQVSRAGLTLRPSVVPSVRAVISRLPHPPLRKIVSRCVHRCAVFSRCMRCPSCHKLCCTVVRCCRVVARWNSSRNRSCVPDTSRGRRCDRNVPKVVANCSTSQSSIIVQSRRHRCSPASVIAVHRRICPASAPKRVWACYCIVCRSWSKPRRGGPRVVQRTRGR